MKSKKNIYFLTFFFWLIYFSTLSLLKHRGLTGDEPQYGIDAYSIVHFGSRNILSFFPDSDVVKLFYPTGDLGAHIFQGSQVTFHGVGVSLFCIPAVLFPYPVLALKFLFNIYSALVATLALYIVQNFSSKFNYRTTIAMVLTFALPPFAFFSDQIYPEIPGALIILISVIFYRKSNLKYRWQMISILTSFLPFLHIRFTVFTVASFIIALTSIKKQNILKLQVLSIFLLSGCIFLLTMKLWYGTYSPFYFNQLSYANVYELSKLDITYRYFFGHLLSPVYGLFPWNPILILLLIFNLVGFKQNGLKRISLIASSLYLALVGYGGMSGGLAFPARYVIILIPILFISIRSKDIPKIASSAKIFVLVYLFIGLSITFYGSKNIDLIYGRGEAQNTALLNPIKQISSLWPNYSVAQGVGNGSQAGYKYLRITPLDQSFTRYAIDGYFVASGNYLIENMKKEGINSKCELSLVPGSRVPRYFNFNSDEKYIGNINLKYTEYLSGILKCDQSANFDNTSIQISQLENRTIPFPDSKYSILFLCLVYAIAKSLDRKVADKIE